MGILRPSFLYIFTLFVIGLPITTMAAKKIPIYASAQFQDVKHQLGGAYGDFAGEGKAATIGARFQNIGMEASIEENDAREDKIFYAQTYNIKLEEDVKAITLRAWVGKYFSLFYGRQWVHRVITVPPGCPFQSEFILDHKCSGAHMGGGVILPFADRFEVFGEYKLGKGCNKKENLEAGLRIFF